MSYVDSQGPARELSRPCRPCQGAESGSTETMASSRRNGQWDHAGLSTYPAEAPQIQGPIAARPQIERLRALRRTTSGDLLIDLSQYSPPQGLNVFFSTPMLSYRQSRMQPKANQTCKCCVVTDCNRPEDTSAVLSSDQQSDKLGRKEVGQEPSAVDV